MEWMWEPFHVCSGPQSMHLDIICSLTVIQKICNHPKLCLNKYGGSGMKVDPSANPLRINGLKHIVHVWSGCGNHSMWVWGLNQCTLTSFVALL